MPNPATSLRAAVAGSLDLPTAALRFASELFADLDGLGSSPRRAANWLSRAGVGAQHRLLDLGCGNGAIAIAAARACGCRVVAIDAHGPFIDEARREAERVGVASRCEFHVGDVRRVGNVLRRTGAAGHLFDASMMISLLPAEDAVALLRRHTKPGGVMLIDDAVTLDRHARGWRDDLPPTRAEMRDMLTRFGDAIIREHVLSRAESVRQNESIQRRVERRARAIARREPRAANHMSDVVSRQREAITLLTGPMRAGLWMLRRSG